MIWYDSATSRSLERLVVLKLVITQYLTHVRLVKWPQAKDKIQTRFQNIPNHHYEACSDPGTWSGIICGSLEPSKGAKANPRISSILEAQIDPIWRQGSPQNRLKNDPIHKFRTRPCLCDQSWYRPLRYNRSGACVFINHGCGMPRLKIDPCSWWYRGFCLLLWAAAPLRKSGILLQIDCWLWSSDTPWP